MMLSVLALVILTSLLWWLARIGQKACEVDWGHPWLNRLDGLNRLFCRHYHRMQGDRIALPDTGPALLASNHISGLDPFLLIASSQRPLRFLIAREEYQRYGLTWLFRAAGCIPVDRGGRPEKAFREALRALEAGEVIALFPHGRIHVQRQTDQDPPRLKGGVVKLAEKTGAPICPVTVEGVTGTGTVVRAVLRRSRARVRAFAPIHIEDGTFDQTLARLARILHDEIDDQPHREPDKPL